MSGGRDQAGWIAAGTASGAIATATKAAKANKQHIVYGIDASFSAVPAANELIQLKDGASTVVWEGYCPTTTHTFVVTFPAGMAMTIGNAVNCTLASAGGSVVGKINVSGVTV